jgi:hypothetical protein
MHRQEGAVSDICGGAHRFFVITDGTVEGLETIKVYAVICCTVCKDNHLIEHIMQKDAAKLTPKG